MGERRQRRGELTLSEVISEQDAAARKEQDVATIREQRLREGREALVKEWFYYNNFFENGDAVANYLNMRPAQGPGEAMTTVRDDGKVALFIYIQLLS
jgi:hypothetical protein